MVLPNGVLMRFGQGSASNMAFCPHNNLVAVTATEGVWWYKLPTFSPIVLWKKEDETALFTSCTFPKMEDFSLQVVLTVQRYGMFIVVSVFQS